MNVNTTEQLTNNNVTQTTSVGVSPLLTAFLNRHILETVKEKNVFNQKGIGQNVTIPKNKTKTITFHRREPLPVNTEALTEGVTPKGDALSVTEMTAQPTQYGHYVAFTDEFDFYNFDPTPAVLNVNEALAEQAASIFDLLTLNVLKTCTNYQFGGGAASASAVASEGTLTAKEVARAVRTLKANKASPVSGNDYVCVLDPYMAHDLMTDEGWEEPKNYCDPKDKYAGELGRLYGVRFVDTTQNMVCDETGSGGIELHRCFFFGKNAYGSTSEKGNIETVIQPPVDPLHQISTIGWKGHHVAKILTDSWMVQFVGAIKD